MSALTQEVAGFLLGSEGVVRRYLFRVRFELYPRKDVPERTVRMLENILL